MMLSNYTLDALLHGQSIKSVEIERPYSIHPEQNISSIKCGNNIYFIYSIKVWSIIMNRILNLTSGSCRSYSGVSQIFLRGLANLTSRSSKPISGVFRSYSEVLGLANLTPELYRSFNPYSGVHQTQFRVFIDLTQGLIKPSQGSI